MSYTSKYLGILFIILIIFISKSFFSQKKGLENFELKDVSLLWDKGKHNGFPDLLRFNDYWYCSFRTATTHKSIDGEIQIIRSSDWAKWEEVTILSIAGTGLRDPKLSITPDSCLLVTAASQFRSSVRGFWQQSVAWKSKNGIDWSHAIKNEEGLGTWRWSLCWLNKIGYSIGYTGKDQSGTLYKTMDGENWTVLKKDFYPELESYPNEASISFDDDNTAYCLLRRERISKTALLGKSKFPYTEWTWNDLGIRIGGPKLLTLNNDTLIALTRLYEPSRTAIIQVNNDTGKIKELLVLPSGGDNGYGGMVEYNGYLWIAYYSSHLGNTNIYKAKVKIDVK